MGGGYGLPWKMKEVAMGNIRKRLIIQGRVQGVWFRDSTRQEARSLNVTGWVKNRRDGGVEAVAEGPEDAVGRLIQWCHHGPPAAEVSSVEENEEEWTGEFSSFDVVF
jgi:acylphosphatase